MTDYFRPIASTDTFRPHNAHPIAGGWTWFTHVEVMRRNGPSERIAANELNADVLTRITAPRPDMAGLGMDRPTIMGILNVTPDSFSDGGQHNTAYKAVRQAAHMIEHGADILDIGGESTRPGAVDVEIVEEIQRTAPVIEAIRKSSSVPISIDTRKSPVAAEALKAGANLVNDVAAFSYDPDLAGVVSQTGAPVCLMHAQGDPATMQKDPQYDNVLLDVYDYLERKVSEAEAAGIPRSRIMIDPGIGFGKTLDHNLTLLKGLSLFHTIGCPILLGASRKRFIGTIGNAPDAQDRAPGSVAVALAGVSQGVQMVRVHDVKETAQALALHMAVTS
jgi:dihydropteroate synthase